MLSSPVGSDDLLQRNDFDQIIMNNNDVFDRSMSPNANTAIVRGRPICDEFEDEVLFECQRSLQNSNDKNTGKKSSKSKMFSYAHVKKCAIEVFNRDYYDNTTSVKKWQQNKKTRNLCFTNKWIHGVLQRHFKQSNNYAESSSLSFSDDDLFSDIDLNIMIDKDEIDSLLSTSPEPSVPLESVDTKQLYANHARGRPICEEFETEVMMECERSICCGNNMRKRASTGNDFSYAHVRKCAMEVWNRDYWDTASASFIKKWHLNQRTYKLSFSNKWISGLMFRYKCKNPQHCALEEFTILETSLSTSPSLSPLELPSQSQSLVTLPSALLQTHASSALILDVEEESIPDSFFDHLSDDNDDFDAMIWMLDL